MLQQLEAKRAALTEMHEHFESTLIPQFFQKVAARAEHVVADVDISIAVRELFRQSLLLAWGAVEVLARDLFVSVLNAQPHLSLRLVEAPPTRKIFGEFALKLSDLQDVGFNPSARLGTLLGRAHRLDRLETIKDIFGVLFPEAADLRERLGSRSLWLLYQRRHLIAHRRGLVDAEYVEKTREQLQPGTQLVVSKSGILEALTVTADTGSEFLLAAVSCGAFR